MKILTCGSSPRSGYRNAWTRFKNVNGASSLSNIWNFYGAILITSCRDWWPWTKLCLSLWPGRQSNNQWCGGIAAHPAPKNSECKNPLGKFSPRFNFLGSRRHPPHWLSSKRPNYQRGVLIISAGAFQDILKEMRPRWGKVTKRALFLHENAPAHRALATQKKLIYLDFHCLDHPHFSPDLAPSDYYLFLDWKKQLKVRNFSSDPEVIAAAETWLDGQPSEFFLSGLQKLQQRAKKGTELRGEYVEQIPSWVAVACFLSGRAKDLSASLVTTMLDGSEWLSCMLRPTGFRKRKPKPQVLNKDTSLLSCKWEEFSEN